MKEFEKQRIDVVKHLKKIGYIRDPKIKKSMLKVKREQFVLPDYRRDAYLDMPLPIPGDATISAPHMHAIFMSSVKLKPGDKVLEVGAGSGILLAYIKEVVGSKGKVIGIEFTPETYEFTKKNLKKSGYAKKVKLVLGDGSKGLPKEAPFDKIIVSAACPEIPRPLIKQLKPGGILVAPVGGISSGQDLIYLEKTKKGELIRKGLGGVIFVPLVGKYGYKV